MSASPLLEARGIAKRYRVGRAVLTAVDGVDLTIGRGEAVAVVGESGSGKSTLARILVGLEAPSQGEVRFDGRIVDPTSRGSRLSLGARVGVVFQDPYGSLNPRLSVARAIEEPLIVHRWGDASARRRRVAELLEAVGLDPDLGARRPRGLSGGQRQRVAIARALALDPELLVLDEPVSALDVSVQAQILNLLADLRRARTLAYLFISHDLAVVRQVAERIAVMYLGRIVEIASADELYGAAAHPYTLALLSSAAEVEGARASRIPLQGDPPSPIERPGGCPFHPRCFRARERCGREDPVVATDGSHRVACWYPGPVEPEEVRRLGPGGRDV
ncbi:MAG: ABC transporter ATP-binding protein [Actinomycetota bacterium]|jgi:oligopeptide/dipeptide ABC transporter ATP-binding protein|nr:MAG: ABC transporter ATP-binding protein [Actinomycetota bacterium]